MGGLRNRSALAFAQLPQTGSGACDIERTAPSIVGVRMPKSFAESRGHRFIRSLRLRERQHQLPLRHRDQVSPADREPALLQPPTAHAQKRNAIVSAPRRRSLPQQHGDRERANAFLPPLAMQHVRRPLLGGCGRCNVRRSTRPAPEKRSRLWIAMTVASLIEPLPRRCFSSSAASRFAAASRMPRRIQAARARAFPAARWLGPAAGATGTVPAKPAPPPPDAAACRLDSAATACKAFASAAPAAGTSARSTPTHARSPSPTRVTAPFPTSSATSTHERCTCRRPRCRRRASRPSSALKTIRACAWPRRP
jgi:hypothetical protein